jgi:hypothetical protein
MRGQTRKSSARIPRLRRPKPDYDNTVGATSCCNNTNPAVPSAAGTSGPASGQSGPPAAGPAGQPKGMLTVLMPDRDKEFFHDPWKGTVDDLDPLPDETNIRKLMDQQLREQAGTITPSMDGIITSLIEIRISLTKGYKYLAERGRFRRNSRTGALTASNMFDLIKTLEDSQRLYTKLFEDQVEALRKNGLGGRRPQDADNWPLEGFEGKPLEVVNEINMLLGLPDQTAEEVIAEAKQRGIYNKVMAAQKEQGE